MSAESKIQRSEPGARLQELLGQLEELPEPTRLRVRELVSELLSMYGDGLGRMVGAVQKSRQPELEQQLLEDEVVANLLRLHDLYPVAEESSPVEELCELCGNPVPAEHSHLLQTVERRILCSCETCFALRAHETGHRPVGERTLWLEPFVLPDALWKRLEIPIGLAFFFHSSTTGRVIALYPGPLGATEATPSEEAWRELAAANPVLDGLEVDAEALILNRLGGARQAAIAPIDRCYGLVGQIRRNWVGFQGGPAMSDVVPGFFEALRAKALLSER